MTEKKNGKITSHKKTYKADTVNHTLLEQASLCLADATHFYANSYLLGKKRKRERKCQRRRRRKMTLGTGKKK
jgi:hypothetical protein